MNVAAIRWFRWFAGTGMMLSFIAGVLLLISEFNGWLRLAKGGFAGANNGPFHLLTREFTNVFLPTLTPFMASAVLYTTCEIALHLNRIQQTGPEE